MVKRTGPTNPVLKNLILDLKKLARKEKKAIWKRIVEDLEKPTRQRREVNLYKINKYVKENETALVPGKVLGDGNLTKKLTVAAWKFSQEAFRKINKVGKAISIQQLMKENPKGKNIRIIG